MLLARTLAHGTSSLILTLLTSTVVSFPYKMIHLILIFVNINQRPAHSLHNK